MSSYLVEISEICLRKKDSDGLPLVERIMDKAGQKGTGLWTVVSALQLGASVPTIYASLNARVLSSMKDQRQIAEEILKGPQIIKSNSDPISLANGPIMDAVVLSTIASYAQGMELLRLASIEYSYDLHMPSIAQIWKGGCIIRSRLLKRIQEAFEREPELSNLCLDPWFSKQINQRIKGLALIVSHSAESGVPVPCFSSSLDYFNSLRTSRLPQNMVQAMRDCFGSHTYERLDMPGSFHTEWLE